VRCPWSNRFNPKLEPFREWINRILTNDHFIGTRILKEIRFHGYNGSQTAFLSHSRRVSPQPPGKTRIGSVKTPTISEMPFSTVLGVFNHYLLSSLNLIVMVSVNMQVEIRCSLRAIIFQKCAATFALLKSASGVETRGEKTPFALAIAQIRSSNLRPMMTRI